MPALIHALIPEVTILDQESTSEPIKYGQTRNGILLYCISGVIIGWRVVRRAWSLQEIGCVDKRVEVCYTVHVHRGEEFTNPFPHVT